MTRLCNPQVASAGADLLPSNQHQVADARTGRAGECQLRTEESCNEPDGQCCYCFLCRDSGCLD